MTPSKRGRFPFQDDDTICGYSIFSRSSEIMSREYYSRIIGGREITRHSEPWLVSLCSTERYILGENHFIFFSLSSHAFGVKIQI